LPQNARQSRTSRKQPALKCSRRRVALPRGVVPVATQTWRLRERGETAFVSGVPARSRGGPPPPFSASSFPPLFIPARAPRRLRRRPRMLPLSHNLPSRSRTQEKAKRVGWWRRHGGQARVRCQPFAVAKRFAGPGCRHASRTSPGGIRNAKMRHASDFMPCRCQEHRRRVVLRRLSDVQAVTRR